MPSRIQHGVSQSYFFTIERLPLWHPVSRQQYLLENSLRAPHLPLIYFVLSPHESQRTGSLANFISSAILLRIGLE